ncbi:MAG: helix-turn-helix domain-containing protein [Acidobacteria bacterium]|nr:helix-turn-helix domain-containing protein [Acidobacteriota bacterium]MBI3662539.1 helix-turn-helix domain-containing protein [Acidobacteriota bacterium]
MTHGVFGERLKREREMRGVGLEEISAATRISTRFLAALENERWHELPGGVFNRGFIRAVARYLGLDEESLVAEYALVTHDPPKVAVWADLPVKPRAQMLPWLVLALVVAVGAGGWFAWRHYAPLWNAWRQPLPPPPTVRVTPPPANAAAVTPQENPAGAPETEVLQLKIDAVKPTRVKVAADGIVKFNGRMQANQSERFDAKEKFEVSSEISGAVLLELNGQIMMFEELPDAPGRLMLDRTKLKKAQGGIH